MDIRLKAWVTDHWGWAGEVAEDLGDKREEEESREDHVDEGFLGTDALVRVSLSFYIYK